MNDFAPPPEQRTPKPFNVSQTVVVPSLGGFRFRTAVSVSAGRCGTDLAPESRVLPGFSMENYVQQFWRNIKKNKTFVTL